MKRAHKAFTQVLAAAKLDAELHPKVSLLELAGDCRILIENHISVIHYATQQVRIRVSFGQINIAGRGLKLARLGKEQLVITGCIESINLCREGSR